MAEPDQAFLLDRFEDLGNTVRNRRTGRILSARIAYPTVRVGGNALPKLLLHRVLWIMRHGAIPNSLVVDHVNGDPHNRADSNLRLATYSNNQWNRKRNRNGTLHPGVYRSLDAYVVTINANYERHYAGRFSDYEQACAVADALRAQLHGDFRRT